MILNDFLQSPFALIVAIAFADAVIGGSVMAHLQRIGWRQRWNNAYQITMFVAVGSILIWKCDWMTISKVTLMWLCYVPDVLFYWFLPVLKPLHIAVTGYVPSTSLRIPIPAFYTRDEYRGAIGFVVRENLSARTVCTLALLSVIAVWLW